jgi:hypothetical protein
MRRQPRGTQPLIASGARAIFSLVILLPKRHRYPSRAFSPRVLAIRGVGPRFRNSVIVVCYAGSHCMAEKTSCTSADSI